MTASTAAHVFCGFVICSFNKYQSLSMTGQHCFGYEGHGIEQKRQKSLPFSSCLPGQEVRALGWCGGLRFLSEVVQEDHMGKERDRT
jgi:hypothetical protein